MPSLRTVLALPFAPATFVMGRVWYLTKFILIGAVLLAPAAYVGKAYLGQQDAQIAFSAKERVGVAYLRPAIELLDRLVVARTTAVRAAAGDATAAAHLRRDTDAVSVAVRAVDAADAAAGAVLAVTGEWKALRAQIAAVTLGRPGDPAAAFAAYTKLTAAAQKLIVDVGNNSNLILDPDLDTFYLMDSLVNRLPTLVDMYAQATAFGSTARGGQSLDTRIQLAVDKGVVTTTLANDDANFATAFQNTHDARLKPALAGPLRSMDAAAGRVSGDLTAQVKGQAAVGSGAAAARGVGAAASGLALARADAPWLDRLLAARMSRLSAQESSVVQVAAIAVAIGVYLFIGFFLAVRGSLRRMLDLAHRLARGEVDHDLRARGRDEVVGATAELGRVIVGYFRRMAGAASAVADGDLTVDVERQSEADLLGNALRSMVAGLRDMVGAADAAATRLAGTAQEMAGPPVRWVGPWRRSPGRPRTSPPGPTGRCGCSTRPRRPPPRWPTRARRARPRPARPRPRPPERARSAAPAWPPPSRRPSSWRRCARCPRSSLRRSRRSATSPSGRAQRSTTSAGLPTRSQTGPTARSRCCGRRSGPPTRWSMRSSPAGRTPSRRRPPPTRPASWAGTGCRRPRMPPRR